jgi:hypothetical protein
MSVTDLPMQKCRIGVTIQTTITRAVKHPMKVYRCLDRLRVRCYTLDRSGPLLTWCCIQIPCLVR